MYQDREIECKDCGAGFTFTEGEQRFYAEKGFENDPVRCPDCRSAKKRSRGNRRREFFEAVCAGCGAETQVPFKPTNGRPVYCRECYENKG